MKKKILAIVVIISVVVAGVGVGIWASAIHIGANKNSKESFITITDTLGRSVKVPTNVTRIVAAGPGALRLIVYLNATNKVVGIENIEKTWDPVGRPYIMAHPELRALPSIGPGGPGKLPNLEALIKVRPQVIFMTYVDINTANEIQEKTGIPVVVLSYGKHATFNDQALFKSLIIGGKILDKEKRAQKVISFIKSIVGDLSNRTKNVTPKSVYVGGIGYKGVHGIESTEGEYPPFIAVHADNVVKLGWGHYSINKEDLLKWQPEYIFIDESGLGIIFNDYKEDPGFYNSLEAVKNGDVYGQLPFNYYATNIGTALADSYFIGKVLYPSCFEDINPITKANEIYAFLDGKPVYQSMAEKFGGFGRIDFANETVIPYSS